MNLSKVHINTFLLVGSSLLTKAVLFFLYIYVARLLGPTNYGLITSSTEYVGIFLIVATFGFQMASVREFRTPESSYGIEIFNKILPMRLFFGLISFLSCFFINIILYWGSDNFYLILILSIVILFEPLENHFYTFFWAHEELKYPAIGEVCKVLVYVLSFFFLNALMGISVLNLIIASVGGYLSSLFVKYFFLVRKYDYTFSIDWDKAFLKRFFQQSFYFGIVSILYICSLRVDVQMLNLLSGNKEVGYYAVGWQIVQVGIVFVQALSTALFPNSMKSIHEYQYRNNLKKKLNKLVFLMILFCILATILSPYILIILYGKEYKPAALVFSLLIWYLPMRLYGIVGSQILESGTWYKKRIYIYATPLAFNVLLNSFIIPIYGAIGAAISALFSNLLLLLLIYYYSIKYEALFFKK